MHVKWREVRQMIAEDDVGKHDIRIAAHEIDWIIEDNHLHLDLGYKEHCFLGDWAKAQLSGRMGISVKYFKGCDAKTQAKLIRQWLREDNNLNKDLLIRLKGRWIRAILAGYYDPFDNSDLMELWERNEPVSKFYYYPTLADKYFHLRAFRKPYTDKDEEAGKPMQGTLIRNSEVGMLALSVRPTRLRYGLSSSRIGFLEHRSMFYKKHMGIDREVLDQQFRRGVALSCEASKDWTKSIAEVIAKVEQEGY